ncbi:hypothetical protein [Blastopirellula marina]|uniref:Uncharacterized protein n=1 Tax=Blastopirellula marina TaxID=124 RepID=A0A2S8GPL3_9BACT|nr:hypothetical protein [Blastopirellula marina]PQO46291.1 hypothetical protein C5Y93_09920 [Blastopirellula marina]
MGKEAFHRIFSRLTILRRIHWVTWCAMVLVAFPLLLIMVPGEPVGKSPPCGSAAWQKECSELEERTGKNLPPNLREVGHNYKYKLPGGNSVSRWDEAPLAVFEHGWPVPFLARSRVYNDHLPSSPNFMPYDIFPPGHSWSLENTSWCYVESWPSAADDWIVRPWALLVDAGVALMLLIGVAVFVQWRIGTGSSGIRFRLFDLMMLFTVLGVFIGLFAYHDHLYSQEERIHQDIGEEAIRVRTSTYQGPVWLRKLAGNEFYLSSMHHVTSATIDPGDQWEHEFARLATFPYLTSLTVEHWLPVEAIESLRKNHQLTFLALPPMHASQQAGRDPSVFGVDDFSKLEPLKLNWIFVAGDAIKEEHIRLLAGMPEMQLIFTSDVSVHPRRIDSIREQFPNVPIVRLWSSELRSVPRTKRHGVGSNRTAEEEPAE